MKKNIFANRVRIRVCGILIDNDRILLVKHLGIGQLGYFWAPPGGEVHFGESLKDALKREFEEETHLQVRVDKYLFVNEYIQRPYHSIEIFFLVVQVGGNLACGKDPELGIDDQIIAEINFFTFQELKKLPNDALHNALVEVKSIKSLNNLNGIISFFGKK